MYKLLFLLFISLHCQGQEKAIGYKDTANVWHLMYDLPTIANTVLTNAGMAGIMFNTQTLSIADTNVQLHGTQGSAHILTRVVFNIDGDTLRTAPDPIPGYVTCEEVTFCCSSCTVTNQGNCDCITPVCGGGCEKRTFGEPTIGSISDAIRSYLFGQ